MLDKHDGLMEPMKLGIKEDWDVTAPAVEIPVIRITNPFDPREHVRESLQWAPTKTLTDYLPAGMAEHIVSINGKVIPAESFGVTHLDRTDNIVMCPVPQGGDEGGKGVLRMVAMIAVAVFAPYAAGYMLTGSFAVVSTAAATALSIGITMAGAMLVNAILPPAKPTQSIDAGGTTSSSYGIDGAKNTSLEGIPYPVCYGEFRHAGNLLSLHVENVGTTQVLYMLLAAGEGPIASITDIKINDQPIENFTGVETAIRLGTKPQALIPWFDDTFIPQSVNQKLATDKYSFYTTQTEVDKLRLDFVAPTGLGQVNGTSGNREAVTVTLSADYRKIGDTDWTPIGDQGVVSYITRYTWQDQFTGEIFYSDSPPPAPFALNGSMIYDSRTDASCGCQYGDPVYGGVISMTDSVASAVRKSVTTPQLPLGQYEVRMKRITPDSTSDLVQDDVYISDINEIVLDDVTHIHTALLGLKITLGDQISGMPTVTFKNGGKIVRAWDDATGAWTQVPSKNPAWLTLDAMTHSRYGGGMADSRFDMEMWKEWARHCDEFGLVFNGVIDTEGNLWEQLQPVFRVGHAQPIGVGTRYTVAIERAADPVMMFGVGNIIEGTFKNTWLPVNDRANEIEVVYYPKDDDNKQHQLRIIDPVALTRGEPTRSSSITMLGVDSIEQATKEAMLQLNINRNILQTVEFGAPLDALACTVGDVILVQHDMPQWGYAGRTERDSTASKIMLDRPVSMSEGKQYKLLVLIDALERAAGSVVSVAGTTVIVTGWDGTGRVKRLKVGAVDRQVMSTFDAGGAWGIVLDNADGINTGDTYGLWDTDVIEERDVVVPGNVETTQLTVQSPFSCAPDTFVNWMFGEVNKVKKPFRVKKIAGSHEYRRDLTVIEYNETIYDMSGVVVPTPDYSDLPGAIDHVTIGDVVETLIVAGRGYRSQVTVTFDAPNHPLYRNAQVQASINGAAFQVVDNAAVGRSSIELTQGDVVTFRILARDILGALAPVDTAPTVEYEVLGKLAPPGNVENFRITRRVTDMLLEWDSVPDADLRGYEIREGSSWDSARLLVSEYMGTSFPVDESEPGTYTYLIRSWDGERYSKGVSIVTIELTAPATVTGFDCVQNGDRIDFRWNKNTEDRLVGYEIREGATWGSANLVTQVSATSYSTAANASTGDRTFWIKAIVAPGVYSDVAAFSTTEIVLPSDRNIVFTDNEEDYGWLGSKFQVSVKAGALQLDDGVNYGEYTWGVSLPATFRARNTISATMDAVMVDTVSWADASYSWGSSQAKRRWLASGDAATVNVQYQISKFVGLAPGYTEGFSLNASGAGFNGTTPAVITGVTYTSGRFQKGAAINDFARLGWNLAVPAQFKQTFWMIPTAVSENRVIWGGSTASGLQLWLGYDAAIGSFYLECTNGEKLTLPYAIAVDDRVLVGMVQTATTRKLMVGKLSGTPASASLAAAPIGPLTSMRLFQ